MLIKKTKQECEQILGIKFHTTPESNYTLHWTDYEDTDLVVSLLKNCQNILELGTYLGHTTENIANNTNSKKITTVDIVREKHSLLPKFQKHELLSINESGSKITNLKVKKVISTTDEFFNSNNEIFDGIFIDASHDYEEVIKDINNSLKCLSEKGIIILHDVYNLDNSCQKCNAEPNNDAVVRAVSDTGIDFIKVEKSWIAFHKR